MKYPHVAPDRAGLEPSLPTDPTFAILSWATVECTSVPFTGL